MSDDLKYLTFSDKQMSSSKLTLCNWYKSFQSNQILNNHVDGNDTVNCNFIVTLISCTQHNGCDPSFSYIVINQAEHVTTALSCNTFFMMKMSVLSLIILFFFSAPLTKILLFSIMWHCQFLRAGNTITLLVFKGQLESTASRAVLLRIWCCRAFGAGVMSSEYAALVLLERQW